MKSRLATLALALTSLAAVETAHAGAEAERYNRTIYLNRNGGTYTPAMTGQQNDSSNNISTIVQGVSNVPAFPYGDTSWNMVVDCVRDMYSRFNITITDVDPGDAQHIEAVVGGQPSDIGVGPFVGGISPGSPGCGVIDRSIVFIFDVWSNDPQVICEVVAQESGHSFGLDHEYLCQDPMTYLEGCGPKTFQDVATDCGTSFPRICTCGRTTQNSVQWLLNKVGAPDPIPPTNVMNQPLDGATVDPGFTISGEAMDDRGIHEVQLWIDGAQVASTPLRIWSFNAPLSLSFGPHEIGVVAVDMGANIATAGATVTVQSECSGAMSCPDGEECVAGICMGGLGNPCGVHEDCASGQCTVGPAGDLVCTQACSASAACPDGFACSTGGACWAASGGGGGCQAGAGHAAGSGAAFFVLVMLSFVVIRRK